jgi:hypothetical protein
MNPSFIENSLGQYISTNSGLDQHRDYLGISKIAGCPRRTVKEFLYGLINPDDISHRMCFAGYEQERSIREILIAQGVMMEPVVYAEIAAPFDKRLKGHIDGMTRDGDLIEIKSVSARKYQKVIETGKSLTDHFIQCQLYMRYGGMKQAFIVYRCRETYEHRVIRIPYKPEQAEKFERKAKRILEFIDREELPDCECGRCV